MSIPKWEYKENFQRIPMGEDYDGYFEITNGEISLCTTSEPDDFTAKENYLQKIVKELNKTGCPFYINNPLEIKQYCEIEQLREMLSEAKLQIEYLHNKFGETGTGNNVISRIETMLSPKSAPNDTSKKGT